jgi:precorrin-6Y C5,15-methyltransferase (decarboxylating)
MTPIHVIGVGLDGASGLSETARSILKQATILVGGDRHLSYFPDHTAERIVLTDLHTTLQTIQNRLIVVEPGYIIILVSGDPLFFGLGRLLLETLPADQITFHPHLSAIQLAFSRVKVPWQDARLISAHGRSLDELTQALQQGTAKIAILTDSQHTPAAIARLLLALDLPVSYDCWVCENLGGVTERVQVFTASDLVHQHQIAPLNVVVLLRSQKSASDRPLHNPLPLIGIPDAEIASFSDRPGLMTKREIRLLILGELALQTNQYVWDIGAGTGSVSVEIARLCPTSHIYAIEKTAAGIALIQQNCQRFAVNNVYPVCGVAPAILQTLPPPDRVFIGGSGGYLDEILTGCSAVLTSDGSIVLAIATVEHLHHLFSWLQAQSATGQAWQHRLLQVQLSRSVPIGELTRFAPLNPITVVTLTRAVNPN